MKTLLFVWLLLAQSAAWATITNVGVATTPYGNAVLIQGLQVTSVAPTNGQILLWNSSDSLWEATTGAADGISAMTGDVTGAGAGSVATSVIAIRGKAVSAMAPSNAQILLFNSSTNTWVPQSISGDVTTTNLGASTVGQIQGIGIATTSPTGGQVLIFNSSTSKWNPSDSPQGTLCGWYDVATSSVIVTCLGSSPQTSCPSGYAKKSTTTFDSCVAN